MGISGSPPPASDARSGAWQERSQPFCSANASSWPPTTRRGQSPIRTLTPSPQETRVVSRRGRLTWLSFPSRVAVLFNLNIFHTSPQCEKVLSRTDFVSKGGIGLGIAVMENFRLDCHGFGHCLKCLQYSEAKVKPVFWVPEISSGGSSVRKSR